MVKNAGLLLFAVIIDALQFIFFIVFLGLATLTPIGGGAVAGVTGATICYNASGTIVSGLINGGYCAIVGAGIGALAAPIGIVIDTAISFTFGLLLIIALFATGRLSFFPLMFAFVAEATPGVNAFVPAWTMLVLRCLKAHKEKSGTKASVKSVFSFATSGLSKAYGIPTMANVAEQIASPKAVAMQKASDDTKRATASLINRTFDGIRRPQPEHAKTA